MPAVCPMTARAVVKAQFVTALVGDSASSDVNKMWISPIFYFAEVPSQLGNSDTGGEGRKKCLSY